MAIMLALWLLSILFARTASQLFLPGEGVSSLVIQVLSVIWPAVYFVLSGKSPIPRLLDGFLAACLLIFVLVALASCFVSPAPMFSLGYLLATVAGIYIALLFNGQLKPADYLLAFRVFSLVSSIALLAYAFYDYRSYAGYRLGEGTDTMNPNSVAMMAMAAAATAFAYKTLLYRSIMLIGPVLIIYLTNSRAAAVATLLTLVVVMWHDFRKLALLKKLMLLVPAVIVALLLGYINWDSVYEFLNAFFKWDDEHRGVEAGASGRTLVWGMTWDVIKENMMLGVGYRAHSEFIPASSAHNGYLALWAEVGLLGFAAIIMLLCNRAWWLFRLYRRSHNQLISIYTGFFVGFLALAMFERYLLNVGNPASILFMLVLFLNRKRLLYCLSNE